jgi:hypothetical protein
VRRACHLCVPHPARRDRSEPSTSPCRLRRELSPACYGRRRDVRRAGHLCVPHPARRDRSEKRTSPCRSRAVTHRPPATAGGEGCTGRDTRVCSIRRVAIAASRARPRAARATRPPARLSRPATGCALGVPPVYAASSASRAQRAEHVRVPLARCDSPLACRDRRRDVRRARHLCVPHPAHRDCSEPSTPQCSSRDVSPRPPASAGGGRSAGRATFLCHSCALRSQRAEHIPVQLARRDPPPACHGRRRDVRRACILCAASGASCSQRAKHAPVPLARRDPPLAFHGRRRDVRRACHLCVPHPARRDYSDQSTSTCRSRRELPPACYGRRRDMRQAGHLSVPHRRVGIAASRACPRAARAP